MQDQEFQQSQYSNAFTNEIIKYKKVKSKSWLKTSSNFNQKHHVSENPIAEANSSLPSMIKESKENISLSALSSITLKQREPSAPV